MLTTATDVWKHRASNCCFKPSDSDRWLPPTTRLRSELITGNAVSPIHDDTEEISWRSCHKVASHRGQYGSVHQWIGWTYVALHRSIWCVDSTNKCEWNQLFARQIDVRRDLSQRTQYVPTTDGEGGVCSKTGRGSIAAWSGWRSSGYTAALIRCSTSRSPAK